MVASIHVDWTVVLQVIGLVAILVCIFYYYTHRRKGAPCRLRIVPHLIQNTTRDSSETRKFSPSQ